MYAYSNIALQYIAQCIDLTGKFFFRERKRKYAIPGRILIVKIDHLGDCFLMTPLFSYLHNQFPEAQIDIVCMESSIPVFENNPHINEIITYNKKRAIRSPFKPASFSDFRKLISRLRRNKYDLFIDPRGDLISSAIGFCSGIPDRIGFEKEEVGGFMYTSRLRYDRSLHETAKYTTLLNALDVTVNDWQPALHPSDKEKTFVDERLGKMEKPFAVIHPGAGLPYKMWPVERWERVIEFLLCKNYSVILAGDSSDYPTTEKILSLLPNKNSIHNSAGLFSLRGIHYLISQCALFAGNDSVLGHFAGALGVPTLILMNSAVSEKRWRPMGERVFAINGKHPGHDCGYDNCPYPCPNIESISMDDVLKRLQFIV